MSATEDPAKLGIGDKVAGRYRLVAFIGGGGMGRVWRAHDELLERTVAIKEMLLPDAMSLDERRAAQHLAVREARSTARLDHPNVVRVFDVVWTPRRSWIVMEYVPSRSLHEVVSQDGPLPHREAARVGLEMLAALRAAHAAGVLHHDIKPQNVLIADDGRVVLTDFGLATVGAATEGPLLGSPRFLAPERAHHGVSSERTDLWSLGATLYAAVEGRPPFKRASVAESLSAAQAEEPDPPERPGPVHPVIAGLLTRDPAVRSTAEQAQAGLERVVRSAGVYSVPSPRRAPADDVRFASAAVPVISTGPLRLTWPAQPRSRTRGPLIAVAVTAGAAVLAAGVVFGLRQGDEPVAVTAPAASEVVAPVLSVCPPGAGRPVTGAAAQDGWLTYTDPAGFLLPVPRGWTRSTAAGAVCFTAPDGSRAFTVTSGRAGSGDPLAEWRDAERTALAAGDLPGYRKVSMGVLLVTGGGADWEYSWDAGSTRLHTHRVLVAAGSQRPYRLAWTTRDAEWAANLGVERTILDGFRDRVSPASPWSVPAP